MKNWDDARWCPPSVLSGKVVVSSQSKLHVFADMVRPISMNQTARTSKVTNSNGNWASWDYQLDMLVTLSGVNSFGGLIYPTTVSTAAKGTSVLEDSTAFSNFCFSFSIFSGARARDGRSSRGTENVKLDWKDGIVPGASSPYSS